MKLANWKFCIIFLSYTSRLMVEMINYEIKSRRHKKCNFVFTGCENLCTLYLCFFGYGMTKGIFIVIVTQTDIFGCNKRSYFDNEGEQQNRTKQIGKKS